MRPYLMRLLEIIVDLLNPPRSPRLAVLDVALELQRLDYRLFEILNSMRLPLDVSKMREERVPRTVLAEIYGIVEMVKHDYLNDAIRSLLKVCETTEEELREEFFEVHGGRRT